MPSARFRNPFRFFFLGLEMLASNMCKICVWTAQAWSDCMYTLPEKRPEMELTIVFVFDCFGDFFPGGAKLLPRGVHGVPRGRPGVPKGCPGRARCHRWPAKKRPKGCHGIQKAAPGYPKAAPAVPDVANRVPKRIEGMPRNTKRPHRNKKPSQGAIRQAWNNKQTTFGPGGKPKVDASQMPPRNPAP